MYRTDICVKQRNEQEGIELQIWCIQNNIPIDKCNFDFIDSWCYFSWRRALVPGFCRNYEKGKNLQVVSIEDFKTLQLEAMGKQDQKYEVGKWYTHPKWYPNTYIKFSSIRDYSSVYELERISQGEYKGVSTNWSISYEHTLEEAKMEVVSQFLPDGHPDKISSNPEYIKLQKGWSKDDEYLGEIFELKTLDNLSKFKYAPSKKEFLEHINRWIKQGLFIPATKEEWEQQNKPKYKYEVVHCKTKEEWDFVCEQLDYDNSGYPKYNCVQLEEDDKFTLENCQKEGDKIYSFEEWCNLNGYNFESVMTKEQLLEEAKRRYPIGTKFKSIYKDKIIEVTGNHFKWKDKYGLLIDISSVRGQESSWTIYNNDKWAEIVSKVEEIKEENLVGRWVKRIGYNFYPYYQNPKIGKYDLIEKEDFNNYYLKTFLNCKKKYLLKDFELMPEGFVPNQVEKSNIDFGSLNLEDWLRETKKLNLSQEELQNHIDYKDSCNPNVYKELKGETLEEKAEILWNEWNNRPGTVIEPIMVSVPDEWGTCTLTDVFSTQESFKPNTHIHKVQLIEVKTKQIFKN